MISGYELFLLVQSIALFLSVLILLFFVFRGTGTNTPRTMKHRIGLYRRYSPRIIAYILLAAGAITYVTSQISFAGLTSALVFAAVLGLTPLLLSSAQKRIQQERVFADVILYCQTMGMLLKQTHNVYSSLGKAAENLDTSLGADLQALLSAMEEGREATQTAMAVLEQNYPFSCIRNLDVILLHMFYETAQVDDSLLTTFLDDVASLEHDVRQNKAERKALRIAYIIITLGSVAAFYVFVRSLSASFPDIFQSQEYTRMSAIFIFGTLLAFFTVDRYFNLNTTKE